MFLIALLRLKDAIVTSVFIYKMRQHDTIIHAAAFYSVSLYIAWHAGLSCAMSYLAFQLIPWCCCLPQEYPMPRRMPDLRPPLFC